MLMTQPLLKRFLHGTLRTHAKHADHVIAKAKAMDVELTDAEYQTIEQAFEPFKNTKSGKSLKDPD